MSNWIKIIAIAISAAALIGACSNNPEQAEGEAPEVAENIPTEGPPTVENTEQPAESDGSGDMLPEKPGPRIETTGSVPHTQIGVQPVPPVNDQLFRLAFSLPGVERRDTIVSLPGAHGMWLLDSVPVVQPQAIVAGREFAHIHPDGSLHAPLPFERALEVQETGWGERHPWADEREGWEGFVMLYTPLSFEELEITFQLIVESYSYVTGEPLDASDFMSNEDSP
ncbi:MAG: phospholipase [Chloroflexi bacterium]|nr:MAG: phospholipase [Chloroflexota bacterium]MBL1194588.1 phospholipase [Chloroflexota bacterium]NOH11877.1 phospholipase [Chloroflexota bacterium]